MSSILLSTLINLLFAWSYTPFMPPALSDAEEAHFQRIFKWDATRPGELSAVMKAIQDGDLARLKWLQTQGAYIPSQLALQRANVNGHLDIVQWLLTQDAHLTVFDYDLALESGNLDLIYWWQEQDLYRHTLSLQPRDSLLLFALKSGKRNAVQSLLDKGQTLPHEPNIQTEILVYLIHNAHAEMFQWLVHKQHWRLPSELLNATYDQAMVKALSTGNFEQVKSLVEMGYPQEQFPEKAHFLIYAAHGGNFQAVQWLLKQGVPLQPKEAKYHFLERNESFLLGAAMGGAIVGSSSAPSLIKLQPTAMEEAHAQKYQDIAVWLKDQGATPLSHLVQRDLSVYSIQTYQLRSKIRGYLSLDVAEKLRQIPYQQLNDYLKQDVFEESSLLMTAIQAEHLPMVQYMLLRYPTLLTEPGDSGGFFDSESSEYWQHRLFEGAVFTRSAPLIRFLVKQGVDPFTLDYHGGTVLDLAIELQDQQLYNLIRDAEDQFLRHKKAPVTTH